MREVDILKWAAGSIKRLPVIQTFDLDRLLEATWHHRLAGRFLRRVRREPQPWVTMRLVAGLMAQHHLVRQRVSTQIQAVREIQNTYAPHQAPFIVVKGYSCYALVTDIFAIRGSGDIDVLARNPEELASILSGIGYKRMYRPAPHTLDCFDRDDVTIELHEHFPIWRIPKPRDSTQLLPAHNPGLWIQDTGLQVQQIQYSDLHGYIMHGLAQETRDLLIPNPTLAALICCLHVFRDFCNAFHFQRIATIHLVELAELCDLARHPGFNRADFLEFLEYFNVWPSVSFVDDLVHKVLGLRPLNLASYESEEGVNFVTPRVYMRFFSIDTDWSPDDLILRRDSTNMRSLVAELGSTKVVAGPSRERRVYTAGVPGSEESVARVIVRIPHGFQLPLEFSFIWQERGLTIFVSVLKPPVEHCVEWVRVDFGDVDCEWRFYLDQGTTWTSGPSKMVTPIFSGSGYTLRFTFPWKMLPELSPGQDSIPLLLSAVRMNARWEVLSGTLIPLTLLRE